MHFTDKRTVRRIAMRSVESVARPSCGHPQITVHIGSDAALSANSLVVRDVPPRAVVVGVPARIVSRAGSFTQVAYRGMDDDRERQAARAEDVAETENPQAGHPMAG